MPTRRTGQGLGPESLKDHIGAYNFKIEIDGVVSGAFKAVEGMQREMELIEYKDGADPLVRKRPGRQKYSDVTLKKGFVATNELENWWKDTASGKYVRKSISIILNDNLGQEVCRWNLYSCWPRVWKTGGLDGKGNDTYTEEITFCTELIERA